MPIVRAREPCLLSCATPLIVAIALQASCGAPGLTRAALVDAETLWETRSVGSYTIEVTVSESERTIRRVELEVRDDRLVEAFLTDNGAERPITGELARPYTVEGLFQTLDEEMAAGKRRYLRASFDPSLGYPERIELGPLRGAPEATRFILRVDSFRAAPAKID